MNKERKILVAIVALLVLAASCRESERVDQAWPKDEYDVVRQRQQQALDTGDMPIDKAMSDLATEERSNFVAIAAQPSEDLSALNGWSFKGVVAVAPGEASMPPECEGAADPMACWGQKLYTAKGCVACHAVEGDRQQPCPNWYGLYGKDRLLVGGETVVADDAYLANSILNSWDQVVEGYGKTMPPYNFPEDEVQALVAYIKSLGGG